MDDRELRRVARSRGISEHSPHRPNRMLETRDSRLTTSQRNTNLDTAMGCCSQHKPRKREREKGFESFGRESVSNCRCVCARRALGALELCATRRRLALSPPLPPLPHALNSVGSPVCRKRARKGLMEFDTPLHKSERPTEAALQRVRSANNRASRRAREPPNNAKSRRLPRERD